MGNLENIVELIISRYKAFLGVKRDGAEGESRTRTSVTSTVFETAASTIPPLRLTKECNYKDG